MIILFHPKLGKLCFDAVVYREEALNCANAEQPPNRIRFGELTTPS